jgi:predicted NAD-dependent protein-ADP-ribosyltransferase YbiA (DUF1768 family)
MAEISISFQVKSFNIKKYEGQEYWDITLKGQGEADGGNFGSILTPQTSISREHLENSQRWQRDTQIGAEKELLRIENNVLIVKMREKNVSFILLRAFKDTRTHKNIILLEIKKESEFNFYPGRVISYLYLDEELTKKEGGTGKLLSQVTETGGAKILPGMFSTLNWGKEFRLENLNWEKIIYLEDWKSRGSPSDFKKAYWCIDELVTGSSIAENFSISERELVLHLQLGAFNKIEMENKDTEWTVENRKLEVIEREIRDYLLGDKKRHNLEKTNEYIGNLNSFKDSEQETKKWAWKIWNCNIHHWTKITETLSSLERNKESLESLTKIVNISKTMTEKESEKSGSPTTTPPTDKIIDYESTTLDDFITAINEWRGIGRLGFLSEPDLQQVKDLIIVRLKEKCENYGLTLSEEGKEKIQNEEDLEELQDFIIYSVDWDISSISEEAYLFIGNKSSISKIFASSTKIGFFGVNFVEQTHEGYEKLTELIKRLIKGGNKKSELLFAPFFIQESKENSFEYGLLVADRQEKIFHYYYFGYSARNSEAIKQVIKYLKEEAGDDYSLIQDYELRQEEIPNIESNEEAICMLTTFYWLAAKLEKKVETTSEGFWCQDKNNLLSVALTEVKQVIEVSENDLNLSLLAKKSREKEKKTEELTAKNIGRVIKFHKEYEEWGEFSNFYSPEIAKSTGKTPMKPICSFLPHEINEQGEPGEKYLFGVQKKEGRKLEWITAEHLFQALKLTISEKERKKIPIDTIDKKKFVARTIRESINAGKARSFGRGKIPKRDDWDEFRKLAMFYTTKEKFSFENNPELVKFLMSTYYWIIIEDTREKATSYSDSYWGNDDPDCPQSFSNDNEKKNWYQNRPGASYGENRLGRTLMEWRSVFRLKVRISNENNINSEEDKEKLKTALDSHYKREYPRETHKQSFTGYVRSEIFALTKNYWTEDEREIEAICNSIRELEIKVINKSKEIFEKMDEEPGEKVVESEEIVESEEVPATKESPKEKKRISFSEKKDVRIFRSEEKPAKLHKYQIKEFSEKISTKREKYEKEFQEYIKYYRGKGDKKFTEDLNENIIIKPPLDIFDDWKGEGGWKKVKKEVKEWKKEIDSLEDSESIEKEDEEVLSRDDYEHRVPTPPKPIENLTRPFPKPAEPAGKWPFAGLLIVTAVVGTLLWLVFLLGRKRKEENIDE